MRGLGAKSFLVLTTIGLLASCATEPKYYDQQDLKQKHNTATFWPMDFSHTEFATAQSASIAIEKGSQTRSAKDLKEAIESLKSGEVVKLVKGKYAITNDINVPKGIQELIIEGVGKDTIIGFRGKGVEDGTAAKIIGSVPMTFRTLSLFRPRFKSVNNRARIWLEEVFVHDSLAHEGKDYFDYRGGVAHLLGGYYSLLSANDIHKRSPKDFSSPAGVLSRGLAIYRPANVMNETPMEMLSVFENDGSLSSSLQNFQEALAKIRKIGKTDLPPAALGQAVIQELRGMPKERRNKVLSYMDHNNRFIGERDVFSHRYLSLLERLYEKSGSSKGSPENQEAVGLQLTQAEAELKKNHPLLALTILGSLDISSQSSAHTKYQSLFTQTMKSIRKAHGCNFSEKGKVKAELYTGVRNSMMSLYPMMGIYDKEVGGCRIDVVVHADKVNEVESQVNEKVITEMVETDESRRKREAAMRDASEDVWKTAFQNIANSADRSRKVWSNFDKYRTRTESRASGEYLISYKGNPNVPPSKIKNLTPMATAGGAKPHPSDYREKKTVTKNYFLYTTHDTDVSVSIFDQEKKVLSMENMKNRYETKNACVSQSVDGWSYTLLSGNCYKGSMSYRSSHITDMITTATTTYIVEKRLPVVVKMYSDLYKSTDKSNIAEATLGAILYGGAVQEKGGKALAEILQGISLQKIEGTDTVRGHLMSSIQKAQLQ